MKLLTVLWILVLNITNIKPARILAVFPIAALSHQIYFRVLTKTLADNGHELVIMTPNPRAKHEVPRNVTEIDLSYVYKYWKTNVVSRTVVKSTYVEKRLKPAFDGFSDVFEMIIQSEDVNKLIGQTFDLLIVENLMRQTMSLSHFFKAPVIRASSFGMNFDSWKVLGAPVHPVLYPTSFPQRIYNLSVIEIIDKLLYYYKVDLYYDNREEDDNKMLRKNFGDNFPSLSDLSGNIDCIFINVHPIWESNRPMPLNAVYINGLHLEPPRKLPQNIKSYLDSAKNGAIYVSFGTNIFASMLPQDKFKMMIEVLSSLPYKILWKWDEDTMADMPDNFKVAKWLPQSNLLRHPNIRLFINQAGLQSTMEAIDAGVPLIGIPILADQWLNAENYVKHSIGVSLDLETMTAGDFRNAIEHVSTKSYKENMKKLRELLLDQPLTAKQRVDWWTGHLLRHGGQHLRSPGASLSIIDYYEIPLFLTVLTFTILLICLLIWVTYFIMKYILKMTIPVNILIYYN